MKSLPSQISHGRRTRSRNGCAQCIRVSLKCDETRPICRRCERLGFACDYSPRFIWKPHNPVKSLARSNAPVTTSHRAVCVCPGRLTEAQLHNLCQWGNPYPDFTQIHLLKIPVITNGSRVLHWTSPSQNNLVSQIMQLCQQYPTVRYSVGALMSLCGDCCHLSMLTRVDLAITKTKGFLCSSPSQANQDALAVSMVLLSQVTVCDDS